MKRRGVKHFGLRSYSFSHGRDENSRNITEHNASVYECPMNQRETSSDPHIAKAFFDGNVSTQTP